MSNKPSTPSTPVAAVPSDDPNTVVFDFGPQLTPEQRKWPVVPLSKLLRRDQAPQAGLARPPELALVPESIGRVLTAVRQLPDPDRQTMLLFLDGLSAGQIADRLGLPPEVAADRLWAALEQVRAAGG
jgi:DNA-directed RNA polymerase specialized sigma24 family protein